MYKHVLFLTNLQNTTRQKVEVVFLIIAMIWSSFLYIDAWLGSGSPFRNGVLLTVDFYRKCLKWYVNYKYIDWFRRAEFSVLSFYLFHQCKNVSKSYLKY